MNVLLDAIKFNHDPTSATFDALNIRKNDKQLITVPEWRRGISVNPEDSPAAYALFETRGNVITISAYKTYADSAVKSHRAGVYELVVKGTLLSLLNVFITALLGYVFVTTGARMVRDYMMARYAKDVNNPARNQAEA